MLDRDASGMQADRLVYLPPPDAAGSSSSHEAARDRKATRANDDRLHKQMDRMKRVTVEPLARDDDSSDDSDAESPHTPPLTVLQRLEKAARTHDDRLRKQMDRVKHVTVDSFLSKLGRAGRQMAVDFTHEGPSWVSASVEDLVATLWSSSLQPTLRESLVGSVPGDYRQHLLRNWAVRHPELWPRGRAPQPYTWVRARLLYALYPADRTVFQRWRNPLFLLLMCLKLRCVT